MNVRLFLEGIEIRFWNLVIPWMYKSKLLDYVIYKGFELMEGTTVKEYVKWIIIVGLVGIVLGFIGAIILSSL